MTNEEFYAKMNQNAAECAELANEWRNKHRKTAAMLLAWNSIYGFFICWMCMWWCVPFIILFYIQARVFVKWGEKSWTRFMTLRQECLDEIVNAKERQDW